MKYEKPELKSLDKNNDVVNGGCCEPKGNSADGCVTGNSAFNGCTDGSSASGGCGTGNSASGGCSSTGNDAKT
jgi:hypothetical protein